MQIVVVPIVRPFNSSNWNPIIKFAKSIFFIIGPRTPIFGGDVDTEMEMNNMELTRYGFFASFNNMKQVRFVERASRSVL